LSKEKSFPIEVITEESVVRAKAGKPGRVILRENAFTNSAAKCWESAALPPFPQSRTLFPYLKASAIIVDASFMEFSDVVMNLGINSINS
jgi:hypothetical protein